MGGSDCEVEAAACEPLDGLGGLLDGFGFESLLGFSLHLFSSLLLVVLPLHVLEFSSESLNFILILIDLSLVHIEFTGHSLHLPRFLFQI